MSRIQPPLKSTNIPSHATRAATAAAEPVSLTDASQQTPLMLLGGLTLLLIAAYWDTFTLASVKWFERDSLYAAGWIVPLFAVGILWLRWEPFGAVPARDRWIGVGLLAFGLCGRLAAAHWRVDFFDRMSLIPCLFGVFLMVGGLQAIRWAWPALLFLVFMFPLPHAAEIMVLNRLQRVATVSSTFVLQTLGVSAFRNGNLISLPGSDQPMNVAEGCAGLRMATIFAAFAVAMVLIIERPWWDKVVILLSAIPIAIIVNIVRITATGLLFMFIPESTAGIHKIMHDWAGILIMMPLAMVLLWLELQILERLTIPIDSAQLRPVGAVRAAGAVPVR